MEEEGSEWFQFDSDVGEFTKRKACYFCNKTLDKSYIKITKKRETIYICTDCDFVLQLILNQRLHNRDHVVRNIYSYIYDLQDQLDDIKREKMK